MEQTYNTDPQWLSRLNPADDQSWRQFEERYRPKIYETCRRQGLDERDADGLTGAVLWKLREQLPKFRYDPAKGGFRGWLFTVTRNAVASHRKSDRPKGPDHGLGGTDHQGQLAQVPDPQAPDANALSSSVVEDLAGDARLRREMLLREALEQVKRRIRNPKRWDAFWQVKAEDRTTAAAAGDLGMTVAAAGVAANELLAMLRKEVEKRLNRLLEDAAAGRVSEELAAYAGRTVEDVRRQGGRLVESLREELEALLDGLGEVATGGKPATAVAKQLGMKLADVGRAAVRFGEVVKHETDSLSQDDEETPRGKANAEQ